MFVCGGRTGLMEAQLASSAGSFLKVAGPRWPQGEHLYPLNCRPQGPELLQGPPGSVETRSKNPQQFLDESETSKASRCKFQGSAHSFSGAASVERAHLPPLCALSAVPTSLLTIAGPQLCLSSQTPPLGLCSQLWKGSRWALPQHLLCEQSPFDLDKLKTSRSVP